MSEDWIPNEQEPETDKNNETNYETASEQKESSSEEKEEDDSTHEETHDSEAPRKSTRERRPPKYFDEYTAIAYSAESFMDDVPDNLEDIERRNDKEEWKSAIQKELNALKRNNTWTLTKLPEGNRAINNKWVFKIKRNKDGNIKTYKARLVIKGCSQKRGFDYEETYVPVARLETFRILISLVNEKNLFLNQLDVKNAFLQGEL